MSDETTNADDLATRARELSARGDPEGQRLWERHLAQEEAQEANPKLASDSEEPDAEAGAEREPHVWGAVGCGGGWLCDGGARRSPD
jgi:hypothetical protein